jgi:tRNA (cytidine/uridine-2'-O-)-methyltransferase
MKIVLFEPQIPQNTGNIVRTCSITGTDLILVKPLGFRTSNRYLKRAGLDYWDEVCIDEISNLAEYLEPLAAPFYFFSSKATKSYTEVEYTEDSILIFGSETSGLPDFYHKKWPNQFYTIPMKTGRRSLNLANSASIVLYEALRQQNFAQLKS